MFSCDQAGKTKDDEQAEKKEEAVPIDVSVLGRGRIEALIQSSANLEAEEAVKVFARTTNPVAELRVEEGDLVEQGQVLLVLVNDTQKITVNKAVVRLEKAHRDFKRQEDLFSKEMISQQEFNDISYEVKQAELEHEQALQDLEYTEVRAPITGTVTLRMVNLGDMVNVNQHLFDIVNFESLVARVYLPEKNLVSLVVGQEARITVQALGNITFAGSILRIAPTVDPSTGTVKVTVKVDRLDALRPGMFVDVSLVLDTHENALLVPKRALVYDSDQIFVFRTYVEEGQTRVERLLIEPVLMDRDNVEPKARLNEGDQIVIAGQTGLKDNALVRVLDEAEGGDTDSGANPQQPAEDVIAAEVQAQ